jgi:hypothetical protein
MPNSYHTLEKEPSPIFRIRTYFSFKIFWGRGLNDMITLLRKKTLAQACNICIVCVCVFVTDKRVEKVLNSLCYFVVTIAADVSILHFRFEIWVKFQRVNWMLRVQLLRKLFELFQVLHTQRGREKHPSVMRNTTQHNTTHTLSFIFPNKMASNCCNEHPHVICNTHLWFAQGRALFQSFLRNAFHFDSVFSTFRHHLLWMSIKEKKQTHSSSILRV